MNIEDLQEHIPSNIMTRGRNYFRTGKVKSIKYVSPNIYTATVKGTHSYQVLVNIDSSGVIKKSICSCPYGSFCKHLVAVCLEIRNSEDYIKMINASTVSETVTEKKISEKVVKKSASVKEAVKRNTPKKASAVKPVSVSSSKAVRSLISNYSYRLEKSAMDSVTSENLQKAEIVPVISFDYGGVYLSLEIGREKKYVVKSIGTLSYMFSTSSSKQYGKNFEFTHKYENIDERSSRLLELAESVRSINSSYEQKSIKFNRIYLGKLADLYIDEYIKSNSGMIQIKKENPKIKFKLSEYENEAFQLSVTNKNDIKIYGFRYENDTVWFDKDKNILFLPSSSFSLYVEGLFRAVCETDKFIIAKSDMTEFMNKVIRPAGKYCEIKGSEIVKEYLPPEGKSRLYLDINDSGEITGKLEFHYGDAVYQAFGEKSSRLCDYELEYKAETIADELFQKRTLGTLYVSDEDMMYEFYNTGMKILSENMEIYASERFDNLGIKQNVKPRIDVETGVDLLEVKISVDEYSKEELLEMLNKYRKGIKYHRLRDGSFVNIGNEFEELDAFTNNMNISDKAFLKENINVPFYRMLYLDNLASDSSELKINRSREFRQAVNDFKIMSDDEKTLQVPDELKNVMRTYQQYGFRWLKTIADYKFGGILADDMGLGKTLQAISLIQNEKNENEKHMPNLVVCPASLSLNWKNEINRFAPSLKVTVLNGNASERKELIETADESDVVVIPYSVIGRDCAELERIQFNMQFIDEAQYIKNHNTQTSKAVKAIKSRIRFALTGTPVENSLAELWSIFDFIMPGYLFNYTYFKKNFETPVSKNNDKEAVKQLQRMVSPFILRRMKKDVLKELPEKTETVLFADMSGDQRKLYAANALDAKKILKNTDEKERIKILALLTRLRQLCCDPSLVFEDYKDGSAKLDLCMELVEECLLSGHKILIFSQFTSMMDIIAKQLENRNISFYTLKGSTKTAERIELVDKFNSDDTKVFLISLKAGGTGLNLTGADIVIHYDPWWNISAENQASDRAYRIGQKNKVQVFKLITRDTIEEKICELQKIKSELADIALSGEGDIMKMSTDDILELIECDEM